jgi:signal transduction histidine kinase
VRVLGRQLSLTVLAPALVIVVGVAAAIAMAALGVHDLRRQSDSASALQSQLLAETLAARLRATPQADRLAVVERAARRSGAELLLVDQSGTIVVDGTLGPPSRSAIIDCLVRGQGETQTQLGRTRFVSRPLKPPLEHISLLAFVRAPETPFATQSLVTSVAALAALLVGVAAVVAWMLARDMQADVHFVHRRIAEMASEDTEPAGKPVQVRSVDQVGLLTSAFNLLVQRFAAAEQAYRHDLAGALAYDRDRSAFLAALSHELRTPLNAILGFAEVLLSEVDGPLSAEARENLLVVRTSGEHLRSLIGDILDLSALESGELRLSRNSVDLYSIAEDVVREAQVTASTKSLRVSLEGSSALAYADARRLRQILTNLVGNAVKFTAQGQVRVRVESRAHEVAVLVSDTGPGIPSHEQTFIFDEYTQTGELRARQAGTGLGLAITRRLVQMHGGKINLTSKVGTGSRFEILLPREQAHGELRTERSARTVATAPLAGSSLEP